MAETKDKEESKPASKEESKSAQRAKRLEPSKSLGKGFKIYGQGTSKTVVVNNKSKLKYEQGGAEMPKVEERIAPAKLINRTNYPITMSYGGMAMILAPRGKKPVADAEKVGDLPHGISMIRQEPKKAEDPPKKKASGE